MAPPDLAITDATVYTATGDRPAIATETTVAVDDGRIVHVGRAREADRRADTVVDGRDLFVTPGLIDAHAHTSHRLAVGLAQDVPELEWMDRALGPVGATTTDADRVAGSRLAVLEAVAAGVTTLCEYASDVRSLVEAVHEPVGIRTVAVETVNEVTDRPDDGQVYALDRSAGAAARDRAHDLIDWAADHPRVTAMYGPQALDMVTPETMDALVEAARSTGHRLHVHVAQGGRERRQLRARYGVDSAVELLRERDWLGDHLVAAHLHGATADQRAALADAGAAMVGCPSSIAAIDGIVPPLVEYRSHGGVAGIGTDQAPGGAGGHHLLEECRQAWLLAKVDAGDPTALPAWDALATATRDGASALGLGESVGTIDPGMRADLACYRLDTPPLAAASTAAAATPIAALVAGGGRLTTEHVLVDGSFVRRDGRFTTLDAEAVVAEARDRAATLHDRAADGWRAGGSALVNAVDAGAFDAGPPQ